MKFFYDLLPIIAFFIVYKFYGIFAATTVAIIATSAQILITFLQKKRPDMMQLITLAMVVILGGATLLFRNELFIKFKPTAVYWVLGSVFLISQCALKKNLVQKMLEKSLTLPTRGWAILSLTWVAFFFFMGLLNLFVVYMFDTDTWVNFKLFGTLGFTVVFVIIQAILVSRFLPQTAENNSEQ